jgi:hypothetical protein
MRRRNLPILKVERDLPAGGETRPDKPARRGGEKKDERYKQGADENGDQPWCKWAHSGQDGAQHSGQYALCHGLCRSDAESNKFIPSQTT